MFHFSCWLGTVRDHCAESFLCHVRDLRLSNNGLAGTIPVALSGLAAMTWVDLSVNALVGTVPRRCMYRASNLRCAFHCCIFH